MTIWLLALLILASLAGLGYRQGGIRVGCSLVGILVGLLFAGPLGKLVARVLVTAGVKNPTLTWLLGPVIVFVIFSIIAKSVAVAVHHQADVFYKYHAGDLRLALWERLNHRLGLCLGLVNGTIYFLLISFVIYDFSYWTVQIASGEADARSVRIFNTLGKDLQNTGFIKVAGALNPLPQVWFDTADLAGLLYKNPLSEARLYRYPGFLVLSERQEFKDLASDQEFSKLRMQGEPIGNVINYPKVQAIINNTELLQSVWAVVHADMKDLRTFLETDKGVSAKYDPIKILGRWNFDVHWTTALLRRAKPNIAANEMQKARKYMSTAFEKTSFVAMPDHQVLLKNVPQGGGAASGGGPPNVQTLQGQWQEDSGKYQLSFSGGADMPASVDGDRLIMKKEGLDLAFNREE